MAERTPRCRPAPRAHAVPPSRPRERLPVDQRAPRVDVIAYMLAITFRLSNAGPSGDSRRKRHRSRTFEPARASGPSTVARRRAPGSIEREAAAAAAAARRRRRGRRFHDDGGARDARSRQGRAAHARARRGGAAQTGYTPDLIARGLASNRSGLIAAIIPVLTNSLIAEIMQGLTDALAPRDYHLLLGASGFSAAQEEVMVRAFLSRRVDGIYLTGVIHTPETMRMLTGAGIPVVEGGNLTAAPIDMVVGYSNVDAARESSRDGSRIRLHRRVPEDNDRARDRRRGYEAALAAARRPSDPTLCVETTLDVDAGAQAMATLLRRPDVRAVFCSADAIAVGALYECQRRRLDVPRRGRDRRVRRHPDRRAGRAFADDDADPPLRDRPAGRQADRRPVAKRPVQAAHRRHRLQAGGARQRVSADRHVRRIAYSSTSAHAADRSESGLSDLGAAEALESPVHATRRTRSEERGSNARP